MVLIIDLWGFVELIISGKVKTKIYCLINFGFE